MIYDWIMFIYVHPYSTHISLFHCIHPYSRHQNWLVVWNIFYFPIYWESSSQLTNIFQRGWNHQPVYRFLFLFLIFPFSPLHHLLEPYLSWIPKESRVQWLRSTPVAWWLVQLFFNPSYILIMQEGNANKTKHNQMEWLTT